MRWVAGFLLVVAAVLKAIELFTEPAAAWVNPHSRYFLPVEIGVELAVGLLVLSGLYWGTLRWGVLLLFTGFAGYSLYLVLNGAASCGCFGQLHINPLWTFGLDSAIMLGLLVSALLGHGPQIKERDAAQFATKVPSHHKVIALVMGIAVICTALLFRYADQQTALAKGLISTAGNLVILEPERWIGQNLPIADSVDLDLSSGEWVVLLHRHDCPMCQEIVPKYEQRAATCERIALVEVPPYANFGPHFATRESACHYGRLKDDHEWFVQTPLEIRLYDGIVTAVKTHDN